MDLMGPYTTRTPTKTHELRAMTVMDPATSWFEIAPIVHPNSNSTQRASDGCWLARYPRPQCAGYDNGNEFKWLFKELCENFRLISKNNMDFNPQGNAVLECVHQVLGNALCIFKLDKCKLDEENLWEPFMTMVAYAIYI